MSSFLEKMEKRRKENEEYRATHSLKDEDMSAMHNETIEQIIDGHPCRPSKSVHSVVTLKMKSGKTFVLAVDFFNSQIYLFSEQKKS